MNLKELIFLGKVKYHKTIDNVLNILNTAFIAFFRFRYQGIMKLYKINLKPFGF